MTDTFQPGDPAEQQIKKALRLADIILESSDPRTFIANMILHEKRLTDRTRPGEATPQKQEKPYRIKCMACGNEYGSRAKHDCKALPGEGMKSAEEWQDEYDLERAQRLRAEKKCADLADHNIRLNAELAAARRGGKP